MQNEFALDDLPRGQMDKILKILDPCQFLEKLK
jgi:hypothetical protein